MHTWRITRRPGLWPRWGLVEDVEADYLVIEDNGQQRLLLYQQQLVIWQPRDVVVCRMQTRDVIAVERVCGSASES